MPLNFPTSPSVNQQYTFGGRTWIWNGSAWDSYNPGITGYVSTFNGLTGNVSGVSSFNGLTGAVTGVTTSTANTFTALQTFSNGLVATGATLSGTVAITGLSTPSANSDAANKGYVDNVASVGVHYHTSVVLASTDSETFASGVTYSNGTLGVGATLTKTTPFSRLNIDSTNGVTGDRILIRSATTQQWNGVYDVTDQGSASSAWILTRSADANNYHPYNNDGLGANDYFFVTSGASLKNNAYICSVSGGITFGTTPITFALFSTPPVYTAGTGLSLNSLQFSNTGVLSFNGLTGAVSGVTAVNAGSGISISGSTNPTITNIGVTGVNGLTGVLTLSGGTGMSVLSGGRGITLINTGVLSINGSTGAIINVAKTNVDNNFSAPQTINSPGALFNIIDSNTANTMEMDPGSKIISSYNDVTGTVSFLEFNHTIAGDVTVDLPAATTTLAGLAVAQTFTANQTFSTVGTFNAGITTSGITLNGTIVASGLGTFNRGITTSGITLNGTIVASGVGTFNAGITTSGATFTGPVVGFSGFTFGAGTGQTFMAFYSTSSASGGGLWLRDAIFQLGGSVFQSGAGGFNVSPVTERFYYFGNADFNNVYSYQAAKSPLRLAVGPSQTAPILAAYVNAEGTVLPQVQTDTNMVAGINNKGVLFSTAGISASAGVTFTNTLYNGGLATFAGGITASGITLNGTLVSSGLGTFNAGITTSGITLNGNLYFQNAEYIRNTTNGQIDLMPAPAASTAFGFYVDMTSWTFGVILGTIRSSDGAKNTGGNFRFDVPLVVNDNTLFSLGSDSNYRFYRTTTGNDTAQFGAFCDGSQNSGALAIIGSGAVGNANRSPATKHSNPNLYIYTNGTTSANDFIRFEHDVINGNIVSGGTSGILMQPGSGWLGISGGISASGGVTFGTTVSANNGYQITSNTINAQTGTTYTFLSSDNGKVVTMNNGAASTITVPSGLPVGFNTMVIQLGAGQVGFTAASGVTLNAYASGYKISGQHGAASVISYTTNIFNVSGTLSV